MVPLRTHGLADGRGTLGPMRTRQLNHSVYQTQYHLVWGTRYRRKWLKEYVKKEFAASCYAVVKKYPTLYIHSLNTDEDHVHLQIEIPPNLSIAAVVQQLKIESSKRIKRRFKFVREIYIDGSIWSVGYFVSTIGLNERMISQYIAYQGKKDNARTIRLRFS
jgi:putative transposase